MIRSMTAYGRAEYAYGERLFVAEIKTVNNRYRDIILRMPRNYQVLEKDLKDLISSRIRRGRVETAIQIEQNAQEPPNHLELNEPLVNAYMRILAQLSEKFGLDQEIRLDTLCQMKDVIIVKPEEVDLEETRPGFIEVLNQALDALESMRRREGEAIESDFIKRLDLLEKYVEDVHQKAPTLVDAYREKLAENIRKIGEGVVVDEGRLATEVAFFAERSDITEEIVRMRSHINQFRAYLHSEGATGRRLEFLIQEMNREVNTMASKASDSFIAKVVVEMKSELEKLREQAQNVE